MAARAAGGGLALNAATGVLSGTPTAATEPGAPLALAVTARNDGGAASCAVLCAGPQGWRWRSAARRQRSAAEVA
jgi:hypothetical protein